MGYFLESARNYSDHPQQEQIEKSLNKKLVDTNNALNSIAEERVYNIRFNPEISEYDFKWQHISKIDCFHPSVEGQRIIAEESWEHDWF